ncbi:hypothetical protein [Pseudooceanicola sp. 200-1SW]|uniref:hypothetical protein n=1 Tax=Pseudooceanicola sp. 200-1SW TaxID=3425949 RepID=UPI003D7F8EC3
MATVSTPITAGAAALEEFGLNMISGEELAQAVRFSGTTGRFQTWCRQIGIKPVPGRQNVYDPKQVRHALDIAQGIMSPPPKVEEAASLTEQRRARRAGA